MPHTKNPSLPSIQFILNNETNRNSVNESHQGHIKKHHRQSHSISSLPSDLQKLSLSGPSLQNDIPTTLPSWMVGSVTPNLLAPLSTPTTTASTTTTTTTTAPHTPPLNTNHIITNQLDSNTNTITNTSSRRPPGASHTRSISDYTLAHPLQSTPPPTTIVNQTRERHQTHRRTVSANTMSNSDFYKSVTPNTNLPFINELPHRARTVSPPLSNRLLNEALGLDDHHDEKPVIERDEQTGKYYCPYCKKPFNRPSSLRIHTYSHTGEKPFVCSEDGCGRQFSVQSNMRRHLRVHKLGRSQRMVQNKKEKEK